MKLCCEQVERLLGTYLDDELPSTEICDVEAHLEFCSSCRSELDALRGMVNKIAKPSSGTVPSSLWGQIEQRLTQPSQVGDVHVTPNHRRFKRVAWAMAASVILVAGLGWLDFSSSETSARASTIDFSVLLNALPLDAPKAFRKFLVRYDAKITTPIAAKRNAPELNFDTPTILPGGFQLQSVYEIRIGGSKGIAVSYDRDGEFLAAVFHAPMKHELFGAHGNSPCVIGKHCGQKVQVGEWKLIHLTDPTTCHCLLSRLDEQSEMPTVMAAIAPELSE